MFSYHQVGVCICCPKKSWTINRRLWLLIRKCAQRLWNMCSLSSPCQQFKIKHIKKCCFICVVYVLYVFICFYMFSTEEPRLATGAIRRLSLAKKKVLYVCIEGIEKGMYSVFIVFQQKNVSTLPPVIETIQVFSEKVCFCPPPTF